MRKLSIPIIGLIIVLPIVAFGVVELQGRKTSVVTTPKPVSIVANASPTSSPSPAIEQPIVTVSPSAASKPTLAPTTAAIASSVHLKVPFTVQAPDGDWSEPWQEGCEEAALLMVEAYLKGDQAATLPVAETKAKIKTMVDWEHEKFGGHYDLGLTDIATIAKEYMGNKTTRIKENATFDDIRNELRAGHPVILPAAGQLLKNPYFKQPGPPYHVFVITGFEGKDFITNENGTKRGHNYKYSQSILENAWHDYVKGQPVDSGPRSYLVLE